MLASEGAPGILTPSPRTQDRLSLIEELLDAALSALRQGTLEPLIRQRPLAARWLMRRFLPIVEGTAGNAWAASSDAAQAPALLLRWLVTQLRPDLEPSLNAIDDDAWLNLVAWRPVLALMCHHRMIEVPAFPARYRKRAGEAAVDNLCGLWDVGPSTFYRYVERGKHQMAQIAMEAPSVSRRMALRRFVMSELDCIGVRASDVERVAWHVRQAALLRRRGDSSSALWHAVQARAIDLALDILRSLAAELAGQVETDALVERVAALAESPRAQFDLWQARARARANS